MANSHRQTDESSVHTPLLDADQIQGQVECEDTDLDETLQWLESFLCFLGFNQSSLLSFALSWASFVILGVLLPVLTLELTDCSGCSKYQIKRFELDIVASQAILAAVSLLCLSHNLRKYGIRKFLFVDRFTGQMVRFRDEYIQKIWISFRLLGFWVLACVVLKIAREVIRILYVHHDSWWKSVSILLAFVLSWTYLTTISLSACIMFHLVCNLQVIHFDDYGELLERESDVLVFMEEHIRLRHHLSKISHRFRIFLLLQFLVVTASQFVTLFRTTGYRGTFTFINGGDFAVSSIIQVVAIIICLHAAAKISHRAQRIASVASKWHAVLTCVSTDAFLLRSSNNVESLETASNPPSVLVNYSESDLESFDFLGMPSNQQYASYVPSYIRRQAFVMYLLNNPGGITLYGWTVDRSLLNTIFFIELSLVLFVLGKTIVVTTR